MGFAFVYENGGLEIDPGKLWFLPMRAKSDPTILGLRIGLSDFDETLEETVENSLWIILETGLGEKDCAERIRHLEVVQLPVKPEDDGYIELSELPDYLAWLEKQNRESED